MKLVLLILSTLAFGSVAGAEEQFIIVGTISKLARNQISVKTTTGFFVIPADDMTEVVKEKNYRDLSLLRVGDEISVHCRNPAGKPIAAKIWANVVTFSATVKYVNGDDIEVLTIPTADYPIEEHRIVHLYPDTVFGTTRRDLSVGQTVRIVGLDVGNGAVDAARIALYDTYTPTDRGTRK